MTTNTGQRVTLIELLKDSAYKLTQFNSTQIQELENKIIVKQIRDKATPYIICLTRSNAPALECRC
jgi:type I restriction enzyme M protein